MQSTDAMIPTPAVVREAEQALRQLRDREPATVMLTPVGGEGVTVHLPQPAFELLVAILSEMANGNTVSLVPIHAELTTQQAADLLAVSRPFLIQLLEDGKIPFRKVGSHRRIRAEDLLAYRREDDARARADLDELTAEAQRLGLGY